MEYSVNQLARMSGVTVRTLHFYDELGLLKPARYGANGYRYYERKQLLQLRQILFFREFGLELKAIGALLGRSKREQAAALKEQKKLLQSEMSRARRLIEMIDRTVDELEEKRKMKTAEMFKGFDRKKQAGYERQLIERFGESGRNAVAASKRKVQDWTKEDWADAGASWEAICIELARQIDANAAPASEPVQAIVRRHFEWLKRFWTPNRESYSGHADFIVQTELRQAYDRVDPRVADFLAKGIKLFAKRELTA